MRVRRRLIKHPAKVVAAIILLAFVGLVLVGLSNLFGQEMGYFVLIILSVVAASILLTGLVRLLVWCIYQIFC